MMYSTFVFSSGGGGGRRGNGRRAERWISSSCESQAKGWM